MTGNDDHSPMSLEEAIMESEGTTGDVQNESAEQQTEESTTEEVQETSNESNESSETQEETQEKTPEASEETETEVESESAFVDLSKEEAQNNDSVEHDEASEQAVNFNEILEGEFESFNDVEDYIRGANSKIEELEAQIAEGTKPKFANELIEKANEYVANGGKAVDFFKVQGVDVDSLSPVDKLVTQLQWGNNGLSEHAIREHIMETYDLDEGDDGSNNVKLVMDANKAGEEIKKLQADDTPGTPKGMSEEEWRQASSEEQERLEQEQDQINDERMGNWEKPIEDSLNSLMNNGVRIDLGDNKAFDYMFNADEAYLDKLGEQVEEALYMSGFSTEQNPELAAQMVRSQFINDNISKIVRSAINKATNSTNKSWFEETNNPSAISRGDNTPNETDALPSAEEALMNFINS